MRPESRNVAVSSLQKLKLADAGGCDLVSGRTSEVTESEVSADTRPDPLVDEARFCDWAFSRLGHITVFGFTGGGFMLLAENGERTRGESLALALQAMLERQGYDGRRLVYPVIASLRDDQLRAGRLRDTLSDFLVRHRAIDPLQHPARRHDGSCGSNA